MKKFIITVLLRLKQGEFNREAKNSFPGTTPHDRYWLACYRRTNQDNIHVRG